MVGDDLFGHGKVSPEQRLRRMLIASAASPHISPTCGGVRLTLVVRSLSVAEQVIADHEQSRT